MTSLARSFIAAQSRSIRPASLCSRSALPKWSSALNRGQAFVRYASNGNGTEAAAKSEEAAEVSTPETNSTATDWSKSYFGLSVEAFSPEISNVLQGPLDPNDIEMKPGLCLQYISFDILISHRWHDILA